MATKKLIILYPALRSPGNKKAYLRDRELLYLYHFMQQTAEQFSSHIPDLQGASRPFNTRPQGKRFTTRTSCDNTPTAIASRGD
jgi:hypothetical protein